jgi:hemoglobin-like flavoprotein
MNEKQIQLIQSSWAQLANQPEDLSDHFYKNLVNYLPERKADLRLIKQEKGFDQLIRSINLLVTQLPEFCKVEDEFSRLVHEFTLKGITQSDYATALIAFLNTLEEKLKKTWTTEMGETWIFTFASFHQHLSRKLKDPALRPVI